MSLSSITEGTTLHAKYAGDGEYYPAKVVATSTSKNRAKKPVKVSFNGFDEEVWVGLDELKSKKLGLPPSNTEPKAKAKAKEKAEPKAKAAKAEPKAEPKQRGNDELVRASSAVFDDKTMKANLPKAVYNRFKDNLVTGAATSEEDMQAIAKAMFAWARGLGAVSFAHWFFPMRFGGGATGGVCAAFKMDTLIDLEWSSKEATKPFKATLPYERLFFGETDGSSFPNGGLRATHTAAAFTTWDRSSPCFVIDKVLRIPCSFITHLGACIDDKTPLLRSNDAVNKEGLRLLKAIGIATDAKAIHSFLGWEQEFFIIKADHYKNRPDLVNCGRTLMGKLPTRSQQMDLNYFASIPDICNKCLFNIQATMLKLGCPMAVLHNEVAPAQHEMSPIYCQATFSSDNNVLFMEVCEKEAAKLGLIVLFHEKPFAGINGSGKHNNWSIGTDTGMNFFYPGKNDEARKLFVTGIACLAHGLKQHNELVRCAVAHAGNDHRLGAQEAPPAIISLYPGTGFETHVDSIIAGGELLGYKAEKKLADPKATAVMGAPCGIEDRNRTAPFPFCGNRFEFRAVGSSQNCSFPIAIVNTVMASGMATLASLIEGGMSHRDAVAQMYKDNKSVIFTGNGYSEEWPKEAAKRGLPNLVTTPMATATFNSAKAKKVFGEMGVFTDEECDARQEVMYENYNTCLDIEVATMINMVETGILPACAKDLATYASAASLAGDRKATYDSIVAEMKKLKDVFGKKPHDSLAKEAEYLCSTVKPQMVKLRDVVDKAEELLEKGLYPYPTYEEMIYSHHV
jgi:glutamine synthetase